jgi:hypothetical protein
MPFDPGIPGALTIFAILVLVGILGGVAEKRRQRRLAERDHDLEMERWRREYLIDATEGR